jgi:hypothetical protein
MWESTLTAITPYVSTVFDNPYVGDPEPFPVPVKTVRVHKE